MLSRSCKLILLALFCLSVFQAASAQQRLLKSETFQNPAQRWRDAASGKLRTTAKPDERALKELQRFHRPEGNWSGNPCPPTAELRSLVDAFLATPNPWFPGLGSAVPGTSVSWSAPDCGTFNYAAGLRNIENNQRLTPATPMGIASMTKPIVAAITLKLNEAGAFGTDGLDTKIDQLLTHDQIVALTVGENPLQPRCPGITYLRNRDGIGYSFTSFSCPDLSRISLRDLMRANHGMYDFVNEVLLPNAHHQYEDGLFFILYQLLGFDPVMPASSKNGYDFLKAYGLKVNNSATVGGSSVKDFESSFGNTGFQLLGVILETRTGKSLDGLIRTIIVEPLGLDPIIIYIDSEKRQNLIADGYDIYTREPLIEQTGVYPTVDLNGHTAVNTLSWGLGQPANVNLAGGAAGLIANPRSYRAFLDSFVDGGLLGPDGQAELDHSYVLVPELSNDVVKLFNGFGLLKFELRGFPGIGDTDIYLHNGSLPGVLCQNAVVRAPGSHVTIATGVICQNSNVNAYPDQFDLLLQFISRFVETKNES